MDKVLRTDRPRALAVGVSGGPDSMALAKLLSGWAKGRGVTVHLLTVDHGLRKESAAEARQVAATVKGWPGTRHTILKWAGRKPKTAIQQEARKARYRLMEGYCREHEIRHLVLAHHQDDQAETFLLRLAKGSGLDGLASIRPVQKHSEHIVLLRPFLSVSKERLVSTCKSLKIKYVTDPSNKADKFTRVRLRKVLEQEGMTGKRLAVTAARLERAREALEEMTDKAYKNSALKKNTSCIELNWKKLKGQPDEIALRVLLKAVRELRPGEDYLPRMEKIEDLFASLRADAPFRKRTLGGLVFERNDKKHMVILSTEAKTRDFY